MANEELCQFCAGHNDVIGGICEKCADERVYCGICHSWHSRDGDLCRHVFWSDCGYAGSGSSETSPEDVRDSFFALFELFALAPRDGRDGWCWSEKEPPGSLVDAILLRLEGRGLWTFTHGFLLSMPDLDLVEQRPDLPAGCGPLAFAHIPGSVFKGWLEQQPEKYAAASDGFGWLQSLEAERTQEANAITAEWARQWLKYGTPKET